MPSWITSPVAQQPLLGGVAEDRAVMQVDVPRRPVGVAVRVEVDQPERPVHRGEPRSTPRLMLWSPPTNAGSAPAAAICLRALAMLAERALDAHRDAQHVAAVGAAQALEQVEALGGRESRA